MDDGYKLKNNIYVDSYEGKKQECIKVVFFFCPESFLNNHPKLLLVFKGYLKCEFPMN